MKKILFLLFVSTIFTFKVNGQCAADTMYIDNLRILPVSYQYGDTLKVAFSVSIPSLSSNLGQAFSIDSNQINVYSCYFVTNATQPSHFTDTIILGVLPEANYNLTLFAYCSADTICTYSDVFSKTISFSVLPTSIHLYERPDNFSVYPNPAKDQVTVTNPSESPAIIEIYNYQGKKMASYHINNTINTLSVKDLKPGMYLYSIIIGGKQIETKKMIVTD